MEASFGFRCSLLLLLSLSGYTDSFVVTPTQDVYIIQRFETAKFYFMINPWPPPCHGCKPNNPDYVKYEYVNLHFFNGTETEGSELCHALYVNGTFDDTTGICDSWRVEDFDTHIVGGVLLVINNCTIYDEGEYSLVIKYGAPDVTSSVRLQVHFPPPAPSITSSHPDGANEGDELTLTCKVSNANPVASLQWRKGSSVTVTPDEYKNATSWDDETISTIRTQVWSTDHGISYQCLASNYINSAEPTSASVALVVYHKPYTDVTSCPDSMAPYYVEEGRTATLTCSVRAYPEWYALYWYKDTEEDTSVFNMTSYAIPNVDRSESGVYGCAAINSIALSDIDRCSMEVQYAPEGVSFPDKELDEGEDLLVVCDAHANPDVSTYSWHRKSDPGIKNYTDTLALTNVDRDDADTYVCLATNILTPTGQGDKILTTGFEMNLFVKFSPAWSQYALLKFTAYLNQRTPATLICDTQGYPEVTYSWTFNDVIDPSWDISEQDGRSFLKIASPTSDDLGTYVCQVTNSKGTDTFELQLLEPGIPDEPQYCDVFNRSANEVTFACIPGYDGGTQLGAYVEAEAHGQKRAQSPSSVGPLGTNMLIRTWDLYPDTQYTFYLYGKNTHGRSPDNLVAYAETTAGDPPPAHPDQGSDIGTWIGIAIAALFALAIIIAIAAFAYWKYQPKITDDTGSGPYVPLPKEYEDVGRRYANPRPTSSTMGRDNPGFEDRHSVNSTAHALASGSSSRKSSTENINVQNFANDAYEMRMGQTNLAGMGALSHRSAQNVSAPAPGIKRVSLPPPIAEEKEETVAVDGWEFPREKLYFREKLGEGAFGEVWRAAAEGITINPGMTTVAVKRPADNSSEEQKQALLKELDNMKLLKPHPNVVRLYGSCTIEEPTLIIMEYVPMGNLLQFLRAGRMPSETTRRLSMRDLITFCVHVARGMEYVSSQQLLHRDLAARNVLLDGKLTCKVCDFGMARDIIQSRQYEGKTQRRLPIRWMAPESLFDNIYSAKTDVWAFGVLLWEVLTLGSSPYPGLSGPEVMDLLKGGRRMQRPSTCSDDLYVLMRECWRPLASGRPTFAYLRERLDAILKEMDDKQESRHSQPVVHTSRLYENMHDIVFDLPGEKC